MNFFGALILILLTTPYPSAAYTVSIITSIYKGDKFIKGFMADIVRQTIFDQCELILINANSPGNEEEVIKPYLEKHPNIVYVKLDSDPGLYAVWNMAIEIAQGEFITNANIDDRLKPNCYEKHLQALRNNPDIDLVYSDFYETQTANMTFEKNRSRGRKRFAEFAPRHMKVSLPNNHPMWRKTMHANYGMFDASYKHAGDYEMWLRAVAAGAKFLKVPGAFALYYKNPEGLSTNPALQDSIGAEEAYLKEKYNYLFAHFPRRKRQNVD